MKSNILITHRLKDAPNASSKARRDVETIAESEGWKILVLKTGKKQFFQTMYSLISLFFSLPKKSNVVIQYPIGCLFTNLLIEVICRLKLAKVILLVHDLESYRFKGKFSLLEKFCIEFSSVIIVHTSRMRTLLSKFFPNKMYYELIVFDYLIFGNTLVLEEEKRSGLNVVFAGNLEKSLFINKLKENFTIEDVKFSMYGLPPIKSENCVDYCGCFDPNEPKILGGMWGLVWDGDDIDTCSDYLGQYLRIISPHKFSLYITMGLMPIVWSESAMSSFVETENIGISVSSLKEIPHLLGGLTDADVQLKKKNVKLLSGKLRNGLMLKSLLRELSL